MTKELDKIEESIMMQQAMDKQLQNMEQRRQELFERMGLTGKTLQEVAESCGGEERKQLTDLYRRLDGAIGNIRFYNEKAESLAKSELEKMGLDGFVSSSNNVDNEIEVLKSKSLAREVVNNLGLFVTYKDEDEFPSRELYRTSPVVVSLTPQEGGKTVCTNGSGDDFISQWRDGCIDNSERQRVPETIR